MFNFVVEPLRLLGGETSLLRRERALSSLCDVCDDMWLMYINYIYNNPDIASSLFGYNVAKSLSNQYSP